MAHQQTSSKPASPQPWDGTLRTPPTRMEAPPERLPQPQLKATAAADTPPTQRASGTSKRPEEEAGH
eukprot:14142531-Alexandrium_andersonii.AAC.1